MKKWTRGRVNSDAGSPVHWERKSVMIDIQRKIAIIIVNFLVLAELCISMYFGAKDPENLTPVFMKLFFAMLVPTLIMTRLVLRRLRTVEPETSS